PTVVDFFDSNLRGSQTGFEIELIELPSNSNWIGKSLAKVDLRRATGASVIGILREEERIISPGGDFTFEIGDKIIFIGNLEQIQAIEKLIF
ncbi:TrkA C-terminal domain-containing protein, partial [Candidatus Kapabacteria bacterium]|nr:TrkA C-terminal domain-containing protein [Candidatus Kapabacteria bacterium]